MPQQIIIDTDPGVDDALAIMLAVKSPEFNILGICTVFGNANVDQTTKNATTILNILDSKIPVFKGSSMSLDGQLTIASAHGQNGLGGYERTQENESKKQNKSALEFYIDTLSKAKSGEITVLVIGPITNLAILRILKPDLFCKIKQVIIMGCVFEENGNITEYAEFNVFCDPNAFKIVLNSGVNIVLCPANVCRTVQFTLDDFKTLKTSKRDILKIVSSYIDYYQNDLGYGGFNGGVMYDLLVPSYLLDNSSFTLKKACVEINTKKSKLYGQTTLKMSSKNNLRLITKVDSSKIKEIFLETIA